jgi:parallel beta-helix repeat protein
MTLSGNLRWMLITSTALTSAMCFGVGPAQASHVACGDTITADTTLDSDLRECPNNGIVIGADDIALDLDGHAITGDGELFEPCARNEACDAGVLNEGNDGVAVRDGSVSEFAIGVFVGRARENRVLHISSSKNDLFGFVVLEASRSVVRDSSGSNNLAPDGDGMGVFGSDHIRIVDNSFRGNPLGLHVDDSTDTLIKGNLFSGNSGFGILIEADRNQVRRNRCARNGEACVIVASGSGNVIARNRVSGGVAGIGLEKWRGNLVAGNVVVNARGVGIYLGLGNPPIGGSHNLVRRNLVRGSGGDGFAVRETDGHSVLKRNIAMGSADDGFYIGSRSAKLTRNRARRNGDLGIEAVRGVIDGGGNKASGNGNQPQCTHISCR